MNVTAWDHLTILRNDFERCQIRLVAERTTNKGRLQLDLGLRRASPNLDIVFTSEHSGAALKIQNGVTGTPTGAPSGALIAAATSNGNRYLLGSELSTSQDTANGGISKTASRLPAVASLIVNYAAPAGGDAGADLWGAYMEHITEKVREVRP